MLLLSLSLPSNALDSGMTLITDHMLLCEISIKTEWESLQI